MKDLKWFMGERHRIYLAREAGEPKPWTEDPVLQSYRFCNVYRELDTVTIWIRENIRQPYADHPNLWFMLALARFINWPPTLAYLMQDERAWPYDSNWDGEHAAARIRDYQLTGAKVYTHAYMLRVETHPGRPWYGWSKHRYITVGVLGELWKDRELWCQWLRNQRTLEATNDWLTRYYGIGGFMAYEIVTDMRHTRYLRHAPDIYTWANAGPGALRGLNRIEGRPLKRSRSQANANTAIHQLLIKLSREWAFTPKLEMRDIEHSLCEFDKWCRASLNQGKPKQRYPGGSDAHSQRPKRPRCAT